MRDTDLNGLIQQHILEHEARRRHVDELLERAQQRIAAGDADISTPLDEARRERDRLADTVEAYKVRPPAQWSKAEFERTGPMVVWDTLAQKLEKLVERLER